MNKTFFTMGIFSGLVLLAGCYTPATKEEAKVNAAVQAQAPADTPEKLLERAATSFASVEGLTPEQKSKLTTIYTQVYMESSQIRREIGQSKSLLFSTIGKADYKNSEVAILKKKIVGLDQKRLNLMFKALDDVQMIVGKGTDAAKIYRHFENYEMPGHF